MGFLHEQCNNMLDKLPLKYIKLPTLKSLENQIKNCVIEGQN